MQYNLHKCRFSKQTLPPNPLDMRSFSRVYVQGIHNNLLDMRNFSRSFMQDLWHRCKICGIGASFTVEMQELQQDVLDLQAGF